MSEIGSGSGSSYPGTLDTNATIEVDAPNAGKTKAKAAIVNDLAACILAVETELGVDPAGSKATVVARLDQEHNADGSHKDSLIVTVSGHNQNITGRKVFASGISLGIDGLYGTSTGPMVGRNTVGASGAMWFSDDIKGSNRFHAKSFVQTNTELSFLNVEQHNGIKVEVIQATWNMDTNPTLTVFPTTSRYDAVGINVLIQGDSSPFVVNSLFHNEGASSAGFFDWGGAGLVLSRVTSGTFDNAVYDSASVKIIIWRLA